MKKTLILIMITLLALTGCTQKIESDKIQIVTSFYPIYDFALKVAGDKADVLNLIPSGQEAHGFDPSARERVLIEEADIFAYNGAGFEAWTDKVIGSIQNKNVKVVETSKKIELDLAVDEHEDDGEDHEGHDHGIYDPHTWLNPLNAKIQMESILDALIEVDPDNEAYYQTNFDFNAKMFDRLDEDMHEALKDLPNRKIVVEHKAFSYLAKQYDLVQESISGIVPDSEPNAKEMERIIEFIKDNKVSAILLETMGNMKVIEAIQKETGVKILRISSLETLSKERMDAGDDYISVMTENLENILLALK